MSGAAPRTVLAVVVSRIGDTLMCTPALSALKETWPDCRLVVAAHPRQTSLLENLPFVDELLSFKRWNRWAALLPGAKKYDLAFIFYPDRAQLAFARRVAAQVFSNALPGAVEGPGLQLLAPPESPMVAVEERLRLVQAAGVGTADHRLVYVVSSDEKSRAQRLLDDKGLAGKAPRIALQLKSFPTKSHRDWPLESFAGLIARIVDEFPEARFVVTGDGNSDAGAGQLTQRFPGRLVSLAGQCSLRETAAVLGELDLYVGVDTGPTHLAGALGMPMVALYHAAYPGRFLAPRQHPACCVVEHPRMGEADARQASMSDIPVDRIWAEVRALLVAHGFGGVRHE